MPVEAGGGAPPEDEPEHQGRGPIGPEEHTDIIAGAEAFLREQQTRQEQRPTGGPQAAGDAIEDGDAAQIVAGVESFLATRGQRQPAQEVGEPGRYALRDAPGSLIRRVLLQAPPTQGGEWIPWKQLHQELSWRMNNATYCWMRLIQEQRLDHETGEWTLTPERVSQIEERFKRSSGDGFDLHDVYVSGEARYLALQAEAERERGLQRVLEGAAQKHVATLKTIGQVLEPPSR